MRVFWFRPFRATVPPVRHPGRGCAAYAASLCPGLICYGPFGANASGYVASCAATKRTSTFKVPDIFAKRRPECLPGSCELRANGDLAGALPHGDDRHGVAVEIAGGQQQTVVGGQLD